MMSLELLTKFEDEIRKTIPKFKVAFKDESTFQKVCGFFSQPFNPNYMTRYTTTLGSTVYFPSKAFYQSDPGRSFGILAHEFVHLTDEKASVLSSVAYGLPQLLALVGVLLYIIFGNVTAWPLLVLIGGLVLSLFLARLSTVVFWIMLGLSVVGTGVLAGFFTRWPSYFLLETVILLLPWPSPWRVKSEMRGYAMSLAVAQWQSGSLQSAALAELIRQNFTGSSYYFMSWSSQTIDAAILNVLAQVAQGTIQASAPYSTVYEYMRANSLLKT